MADYTTTFPQPLKTAIYDVSTENSEEAPVRAQKEAMHKSLRSYYTTFEAVEHEAGKFILSVVEDTWVQSSREPRRIAPSSPRGKFSPTSKQRAGEYVPSMS